ncbi:MAG: alpha/beta hydrolase [Deltaproteobacteria bacterium]|nr:alpha/beta hydrolase [Deltaproteobacteria bacterium]
MCFRDHFVDLNRLRLHYCQWGAIDAPPVLLLHGGSAHAHWWDLFAGAVADRYRVIALDLRGHGDSAYADPPAYRIADYASDVEALVDHLGVPGFHLIGHSLGAMIAGAFAVARRECLLSLTLVDAQMRFTAAGVRYLQRLARFPRLTYPDRETAVHRFRVLPTQTSATRDVIEQMGTWALRENSNGRWVLKFDRAALGQLEPVDLLPALAALDVPMCLVRGQHSTVLTHERVSAILTQLPQARLVEIADAHHHVMLDNPTAFTRAVGAFIDAVKV